MAEEARDRLQKWTRKPVICGALGLAVFVGLPEAARLLHGGAFAQSVQMPTSPIIGNQGIITFGQVGNNTLVAPQHTHIGQKTIDQVKQLIPAGAHVVVSSAMQEAATLQMTQDMTALLQQLGYEVEPGVTTSLGVGYFKGVQVNKGANDTYYLMVGDTRAP